MKALRPPWCYGRSSTGLLHMVDNSSAAATRGGGPFAACGTAVSEMLYLDATRDEPADSKVCNNCRKRYEDKT